MEKVKKINDKDNIVVALADLEKGEVITISNEEIVIKDPIIMGHKIAPSDMQSGTTIIKYGYPIGNLIKDVKKGEHIHSHNLKTGLKGVIDYNYEPQFYKLNESVKDYTFKGYRRENGKVGIRNEVWIVNTTGCINKSSLKIVELAKKKYGEDILISSLEHAYGCSQLGKDHENTQKILAGFVKHPNAAGVLVLGLGCENNNITEFKKILGVVNPKRVKFLSAQEVYDEYEVGVQLIGELLEYAKTFEVEDIPVSELVVGFKCGASDAFSGITANPLIGMFSDKLTANGGTSILTEVPEMFGAETILMNRCRDKETFDKTVNLISDFKKYFIKHKQEIYENPAPGNKAGGITTLEDKSLGCVQKGGKDKVCGVYGYAEEVKTKGLNLINSPGNDLVSTTALAVAGAHLILFSTGRGNPLGSVVPTVKISSNTTLYNNKPKWIDYNAGVLLETEDSNEIKEDFFDYILKFASNELQTRNEINGYRDIGIFKEGVIL